MSEFMYDKEKYIEEGEKIIFENNTDSIFGVETGIVFHKSGLYDVDISNNHVVVSKVDERKAIEEAYQKGLETGKARNEDGCIGCKYDNNKWIYDNNKWIDHSPCDYCCNTYSNQWTAKEKPDEIKVGDIITDGKINYLVTDITDKSYVVLQGTDFEPAYIGKDYIKSYHNLHDSKDMKKIAEEINKAIKSKQHDCHTCKHQVASSIECVDCHGFGKWEPKEGVE